MATTTARETRLSDRFTVIAAHQRCHGESSGEYVDFSVDQSARDIEDLIDTLDLRDVVVAGHSLGSRVALQIAADRPDRTLGVVLLDGSRMADLTDVSDLTDEQFKGFLRSAFAALHTDPDAKGRAKMLAEMDRTPAPEFMSYGQAIEHWDSTSSTLPSTASGRPFPYSPCRRPTSTPQPRCVVFAATRPPRHTWTILPVASRTSEPFSFAMPGTSSWTRQRRS
ncbi:alpha/beta fold hydrolase [Streptomyces capitiformicae]|uniref:alpha/beta fold hydrolase n=1 Tax=Streptomyces capitiformicae TaxID=2014920 RepID=UPI001675EDE8|nr:alpha/beta fold hydrolase [Streptomyces capitiformicae]